MSSSQGKLSPQEPRVLLINAEPWLISRVTSLFATHEITVTSITPQEFLKIDTKTITPNSVYKTIWWVDFTDVETQQALLTAFSSTIKQSLVVLGVVPERFLFEAEPIPSSLKKQQLFFNELVKKLSHSQLFFCRELLDKNSIFHPLSFAFRGYKKQFLLDVEAAWHLTSREGYFTAISSYLTRPFSPQQAIIQGKAVLSSVMLKKIADLLTRYFKNFQEVVSTVAEKKSPNLTGFLKVTIKESGEKFLDDFVRNKEIWESQLATLPSPQENEWQRVVLPTAPPSSKSPAHEEFLEEESFAETLPADNQDAAKLRQKVNEGKRLVNQSKLTKDSPKKEEKMEGELSRIFHEKRGEEKDLRISKKVKIVKKIAKKSQKNKFLFGGGMITMVLGGLVLLFWGVLFLTTIFTRKGLVSFISENYQENKPYQSSIWADFLELQVHAYQGFLGDGWLGESSELVQFESAFERLQEEQQHLQSQSEQYFLGILGKGETDPQFPEELTNQLAVTQQAMSEVVNTANLVLAGNNSLEEEWLTALQQRQQDLVLFSQLPTTLTEIFGGNGKRTYAILLQNNLELRPTGGFIQAIGFFTFDKGLLVDTRLVNTYQLDERVLATVLAPAEIKKYLGEETWFLRDSNWNPDFPQTAQRVAWFVRQAIGLQVDGVWAINYRALQKFFDVNPLELGEYDELLTANNLLERVEFHSDDELAGVGQGSEDYALAVFSKFIQDVQDLPQEKTTAFLTALRAALDEKDIFVSIFDQQSGETVQKMGWSGEVVNPVCPQQFLQEHCLVDQIFQVEANIGLNRVGDYIRRKIEHRVDFTQEKVAHTRIVTLENTTRSEGWPLGSYKVYLRFILDGEAQPTSVKVDGKAVSSENLMVYGEGGRRVVGVSLTLPKESALTLEFSYVTEPVPTTDFSYLLFDQKQAGVEEIPVTITFHNPDKKATLIAPAAELFGSSLEFSRTQNDHLFVGARFQ